MNVEGNASELEDETQRALAHIDKLIDMRRQHLIAIERQYMKKLEAFEITLSPTHLRSRRGRQAPLEANHIKLLIRLLKRNLFTLQQRRIVLAIELTKMKDAS